MIVEGKIYHGVNQTHPRNASTGYDSTRATWKIWKSNRQCKEKSCHCAFEFWLFGRDVKNGVQDKGLVSKFISINVEGFLVKLFWNRLSWTRIWKVIQGCIKRWISSKNRWSRLKVDFQILWRTGFCPLNPIPVITSGPFIAVMVWKSGRSGGVLYWYTASDWRKHSRYRIDLGSLCRTNLKSLLRKERCDAYDDIDMYLQVWDLLQ